MAALSRAFFDTSVLLGGLIEFGPQVGAAQRLMAAVAQRRLRQPITAWHCCLEFYAVATRLPEELRLDPPDAVELIESEILGRFRVHQLRDAAWGDFLHSVALQRLLGGRLYDAHIAEIARQAGARLVVTENVRHFASLTRHCIPVHSSQELAEQL